MKLVPKTKIVACHEEQQGEHERKPAAERPIECISADWAAPNGFNGIEKEVPAIEHRDWQQVDESEIN